MKRTDQELIDLLQYNRELLQYQERIERLRRQIRNDHPQLNDDDLEFLLDLERGDMTDE